MSQPYLNIGQVGNGRLQTMGLKAQTSTNNSQ